MTKIDGGWQCIGNGYDRQVSLLTLPWIISAYNPRAFWNHPSDEVTTGRVSEAEYMSTSTAVRNVRGTGIRRAESSPLSG